MNNSNSSTQINKITEPAMENKIIENKSIPSVFSDIKELLKAVEISKSQIDMNLIELERERQNKLFYIFNSAESEE